MLATGMPSASRAAICGSRGIAGQQRQARRLRPRGESAPAAAPPGTRLTISPRALAGRPTSSASAEMRRAVRMPRTVQSETINR